MIKRRAKTLAKVKTQVDGFVKLINETMENVKECDDGTMLITYYHLILEVTNRLEELAAKYGKHVEDYIEFLMHGKEDE